ncbi:MAG TPA: DUF2442 domain-containing protein [Flavipsychrobacter sp.]|nr:DUF2442 domain-containing protein [Flavipsychrobacter sp.]
MEASIIKVWFDREMIFVKLNDGREAGLPLGWFPNLYNASDAQRLRYTLERAGQRIHWEEIDEDLSLKGFFSDEPFIIPKGAQTWNAA